MAKVSLRIYNREIERLVEQGHIDEAIAHCRHILQTFPKHLETYRMLGKAYLETKRYGEAVDVFGRVLMSVPGDFVAHVGLSIINDEENKMDDAIWHMERAFEAQPSNAAIQGELQRLYGRRDGMEPPKIRMTRGALAHMYVQGELYPQAIAEIRAVLAEDPQRADMQVLLAYSYFKGGQKSDASDICNQLLKRYPYCFDANRIMVELLPATAGATESTQVYRMHVGELDPYANFARGSVFQTSEVPDASINLERLEYSGEEVPAGQEWTSSLGLGASDVPALGASSFDDQPDWLRSGGLTDSASQTPPTFDSASEANDQIPDFLRAAGWGESNTPEQPTSIFDEEPAGEPLVPADLPDWLKGQAPADSKSDRPTQPRSDFLSATDTPDWLSGLDDSQSTATSSIDETPQSDAAPASDMPDWLSGLGAATTAASVAAAASQPQATPANDVPDWLSGLGDTEEPAEPANVPDWLSGLDDEKPAEPVNVPDWLSGLDDASEKPTEPAPTLPDWSNDSIDSQMAQPADLPDWLQAAEPKSEPVASVESLGSSAQEQDDAVAWLESLAAKHGAKPEELVTDPSKRSETPPEWVAQAQSINQQPAVEQPKIEDLGASAQEQDDAVAWLESLAAKHGAKPEELVTDPSKRSETPPEWVAQAQTINQQTAAEQPNVQDLGASAQEQDDAVAWLESLAAKHGAKPEELVTDPNKRSETPPEWVAQAQSINQQPAAEQPKVEDLGASAQEQDDAVAWLESLAAKHGAKPEELVTDPNKRSETPPEWVAQAQSINQQPAPAQPKVEDLGASAQEQDDAVAWLESLAAKHGAKPEELVTDPNKRSETPPEWVQQAQSIGEVQAASTETPVDKSEWSEGAQNIGEQFFAEFEGTSTSSPDETGMWLRDLDNKEKKEEQEELPLERGNIPDWLNDVQQPSNSDNKFDFPEEKEKPQNADLPNWLSGIDEEATTESGDYVSQNLSNQDLSDWLSGLDDEPGLNIDPELIRAPSRPPFPGQPVAAMPPVESQPVKSDLPDWLSDVDAAPEAESEDDTWKESIEPAATASVPTEEPAPVSLTADLPDWLKGVDEETPVAEQEGEDAPPWQHREQYEAEMPQPKPTSPSDWHPLEPKPEVVAQQQKQAPVAQPVSIPPSPQTKAQPIMQNPPSPEPSEKPRVEKKKPAVKAARPVKAEGPTNVNVLVQAKGELDRGDIPTALDHYGKLIKKGKHLEETIRDLTESIYRYPVEVGIWQTLGDAYMRANRLKEALEAYNKAEELIR